MIFLKSSVPFTKTKCMDFITVVIISDFFITIIFTLFHSFY